MPGSREQRLGKPLLPFLALFASAIRLSAMPPVAGQVRLPGGRLTVVAPAKAGEQTSREATT